MPKVSVVLNEQQQAEVQMLLADEDGAEALRFLKEVIWAQVQAVRRKELRSHLENERGGA
jgi:hypothetical protein